MKFRKLRIAWSVAWGVVALLLAGLWVRSYWWRDCLVCDVSSTRGVGIASFEARLESWSYERHPKEPHTWSIHSYPNKRWKSLMDSWNIPPAHFPVPHLVFVAVLVSLATIP